VPYPPTKTVLNSSLKWAITHPTNVRLREKSWPHSMDAGWQSDGWDIPWRKIYVRWRAFSVVLCIVTNDNPTDNSNSYLPDNSFLLMCFVGFLSASVREAGVWLFVYSYWGIDYIVRCFYGYSKGFVYCAQPINLSKLQIKRNSLIVFALIGGQLTACCFLLNLGWLRASFTHVQNPLCIRSFTTHQTWLC